ncbi:hypothetical protein BHE74_00045061 [Ensete ventricosum]|nr:hypothetical protein BHE74_00045061 [Ensete ventricosum]RZS21944.1 hypothetical protein BHM03_00054661 [Ensete ventricosum]
MTGGSRPWLGHLQGWLAMARPPTGAVGHGLATCKGVTDCGQGPLQRGDRLQLRPPARGRLDVARASPQGQQLPTGIATCSVTSARVVGCSAPQGAVANSQLIRGNR